MLEKIEGIVLRTQDYRETNKIVTIFSKKLGKFSMVARGAKKTKSRMAAVTQPFIMGNFFVYVNKGLSTLQQGEIVHSMRAIREDIVKTAYVTYISELTDKIMDNYSPAPYIYDQFYQTIKRIEQHDEVEVPIMMYELKLFEPGGFGPVLDQCVHCGEKQNLRAFSIQKGGLLCTNCKLLDAYAKNIPLEIAKLLQVLFKVDLERVRNISIKQANLQLLRMILDTYYDTYGAYQIKSRNFLKQLDQLC